MWYMFDSRGNSALGMGVKQFTTKFLMKTLNDYLEDFLNTLMIEGELEYAGYYWQSQSESFGILRAISAGVGIIAV